VGKNERGAGPFGIVTLFVCLAGWPLHENGVKLKCLAIKERVDVPDFPFLGFP